MNLAMTLVLVLAMTGCKKQPSDAPPPIAVGSGSAVAPAPTPTPSPAPVGKLPAGVTDAMIADADKSLAAMNKFSADVGGAGKDCKKATAALKGSEAAMTAVVATFTAWQTAGNKDDKIAEYWKTTYDPKFDDDNRDKDSKVTFEACQKDPEFAAAMKTNPLIAYLSNK